MKDLIVGPRVSIAVDNVLQDVNEVHQIRIKQNLSSPASCEVMFLDPEGPLRRGDGMSAGADLRIDVEGHVQPLFLGQITAVEYDYGPSGGLTVKVYAYDVLHQLRQRQPVRTHVQVTMRDLAKELTADLGVRVENTQSGPLWQRLVQCWQSDFDLLSEVGERCGIYFSLRGQVLHLLTLEGIGTEVSLTLGDSLLEARVEVSSDQACSCVVANGWDPWRAEQHRGQVSKARVGRRIDTEVSADRVGGTGECTLVDRTVQDDGQAEAIAQSELDRRVAQEIRFWGVADGNPSLMPGTPVEIDGVATPLAGRYVLTAVNHIIDPKKGFVSEIDTTPPPSRVRANRTLTTMGVVTQVADPEHLGRVKVSMPSYQDLETEWLEVVIPGAGAGKGSVILPDVGDRVLLLIPNDDPAQAVVLGGLYGVEGLPDSVVENGSVIGYTIQTPGEQRLRLDDKDKKIRIETSTGNHVQLSPGRVRLRERGGSFVELANKKLRIHAATDLEIEAPGKTVTIRGDAINFERG